MALKRIVVVGGGIGGLAAAVLLGRAGHRVTLLEALSRAEGLSPEAGSEIVIRRGSDVRLIHSKALLDGRELNLRQMAHSAVGRISTSLYPSIAVKVVSMHVISREPTATTKTTDR